MYPTISDDPTIQADYEAMREAGQSHNSAEMFALRAAPTVHGTDSGFMRGASGGRKWISQLGPKSDPRAWVASADDLRAACRAKGVGCSGLVNVPCPRKPEARHEPYRVADDIVEAEVRDRCEKDPGLAERTDPAELRAQVRDDISPRQ